VKNETHARPHRGRYPAGTGYPAPDCHPYRPRSRAPTVRRAPCRLSCAAHRAPRHLGVRAGPVPPPRGTSHQLPFAPASLERVPHLSVYTAPYPPLVPRVHRACSLPSAPTKVRRRTGELWRAHPFIAKTGSRPAIKAAHCPTRRPTSSSAIDVPR
jgi:hypothetical protein